MTLNLKIEKLYSELNKWPGYGPIHTLLDFKNTDLYLAGGSIRNTLIGQNTIKDFDFFIKSSDKEKVLNHLSNYGNIVYGPFGSPRWFPKEETSVYCDLIWINEFYNGLWKCRDIIDVLNQFDFTANAIAIDLNTAKIFNPENGLRDIEKRVLRAVRFDYPNEPISNHSSLTRLEVLWFRLVHYSNKYDMKLDGVTKDWILCNSNFSAKKKDFSELFFEPDVRI